MLKNMNSNCNSTIKLLIILFILLCSLSCICLTTLSESYAEAEWYKYQNSEDNNGVLEIEMPKSSEETALRWGTKIVNNYLDTFVPPLIINGDLFIALENRVCKINKETGKVSAISEELPATVEYTKNPMTYCEEENLVFISAQNGRILCIDADSLKLKWLSKEYSGAQALCPITYKDGMLYTGVSYPNNSGLYFGINAETGEIIWEFDSAETGDTRGFYEAGCYANDDYLIFGSDDEQNDTSIGTSILYSVNRYTGELIDKIEGCLDDIRNTVVYHNGYIYFGSKGGFLYKVKLNPNGTFDHDTFSYYESNGVINASPVVYNGRIYVGVSGETAEIVILEDSEKLSQDSLIYTTSVGVGINVSILAPPILSTNTTDDHVRLYFTVNMSYPAGIYCLDDYPTATDSNHNEAQLLYRPEEEMRDWNCFSPLCVDYQGNIYYKNRSGYLMAIGVNKAYLPSKNEYDDIYGIKVTSNGELVDWNENFDSRVSHYTLTPPNGAKTIDIELDLPENMIATIDGQSFEGNKYNVQVTNEMPAINIEVQRTIDEKTYTRQYVLDMDTPNNNANLSGIIINDTNTGTGKVGGEYTGLAICDLLNCSNPSLEGLYEKGGKYSFYKTADTTVEPDKTYYKYSGSRNMSTLYVGYSPEFEHDELFYESNAYTGRKNFLNVWVRTDDPEANVKAYPIGSVGNTDTYMNEDGSIIGISGESGNTWFPVYWAEGKELAEIKIVVIPSSRNPEYKKEYHIKLVRSVTGLHELGELEVLSEPTCTETGRKVIRCKVCKTIIQEDTIPAKGHSCDEWSIIKEATCAKEGSKKGICSNCGNEVIESIPTIEHIWNSSYTIDKKATYSAAGSKSIHCSVCGAKKTGSTVAIPKLTVKATILSKPKATKKGFTAKWKKGSGITGYELQYALNNKFTKSKKTVKITKAKTVSKKITKLKAKKKYYIRIRTYKTVGGKKYYSTWSKSKTVTTKK